MKKYLLLLALLIMSLNFVSSAHYIVGYVDNADDGTLAENYTSIVSGDSDFLDNVTDIIGIYGDSGTNNVYIMDCELLSTPCSVGDTLYIKVINGSTNKSDVKTVFVTGAGYDVVSNILLYSNSEFISIIFPLNNSYYNDGYFKINTTINSLDSCRYSINDSYNSSMDNVPEYDIENTGFEFFTGGGGSPNPYSMVHYGGYIYLLDGNEKEVFKYYGNMSYTKQSFSILDSGISNPRGIATDGTYFYITNAKSGGDEVYKYYFNGTYTGSKFDLDINNANSYGITTNGTHLWITDSGVNAIFKYLTNGTLIDSEVISQLPRGIANNGTNLFVIGWSDENIKVYDLNMNYANENYSLGSFLGVFGIATNNTHIWTIRLTNTLSLRNMTGYELSTTSSFNSSFADNLDPISITNNGTSYWIADGTSNYLYEYSLEGSYLNNSINLSVESSSRVDGVSNNETHIFTSNSLQGKIYIFLANKTYTGISFNTISSPKGLWCNGTECLTMSSSAVYSYKTNGTSNGIQFNLSYNNSDPKDIFRDNVFTYVSDNQDGIIYRYYNNGNYSDYYSIPYGSIYGLGGNSTNLFGTDKDSNKIISYKIVSNTNSYDITNSTLLEGFYSIMFNCNNTLNDFIFSVLHYFIIDKTSPIVTINNITTQINSQNIIINSTITETNIGTCKYSIYSNGTIDGSNENVTFTCNTLKTATATDYGSYTLRVYSIDLASNENYTDENFTIIGDVGGGGGSISGVSSTGGNSVTIEKNNESIWKMSVGGISEKYVIIMNKGTSRTFQLYFTSYIDSEKIIRLNCEDVDGDMCRYVIFNQSEFSLKPLKETEQIVKFYLNIPENATEGEYSLNIIATDDENNKGSITAFVNLGTGNPIFLIISKISSSNENGLPYSLVFFPSLIGSFLIMGLIIPKKKKIPFRTLIISIISIIIPITLLLVL